MHGIHKGISRAAYEAIHAANYSTLKNYRRSPAHAREAMLHPKEQTPAMFRGELCHAAVLEPGSFESRYVAAPKVDRRTTVGKAAWAAFEAEHSHAQLVPEELYENILRMRDAAWEHPEVRSLLGSAGGCEVAAVWRDDESGLDCKALVDRIGVHADYTFVIDLKTTQDARSWAFSGSIARYDYHAQAAFYLDGLNTLVPSSRRWAWIVIEDEPPYGVAIYEPVGDCLEAGRALYRDWLKTHAECVAANHWPGYPDGIHWIDLPRWAQRRDDELGSD